MTPTTDAPARPSSRRFSAPSLALFLLVLAALATRLPFLMHSFDELDSSNFAQGLLRFSVVEHQPHPPGQFYYIRLLQGLNFFVRDELTTLSLGSALFSCFALVPYFFALRLAFGRALPALAATALTAFSYGYWLVGLRPISDPVATFFMYSTVCALLLGLDRRGWFIAGMALFAFTLGVKQLSVYFLGPFVVLINLIILLRHGWKVCVIGAAGFFLVFAGWYLPTVYNAGGLDLATWRKYTAMCKAQQVETYALESLITHFRPDQIERHAAQNFVQLWGAAPLAVVMLALATIGLIPFWRAGLRAKLFVVFGLSTVLYIFLVTSIFSKYFVYTAPFHCALITAAVYAFTRRLPLPGEATPRYAFAGAIGGLILASAVVAAPLLGRINTFRSPAMQAAEYLLDRAGGTLSHVDIVTNQGGAVTGALRYYRDRNGLRFTNLGPGFRYALDELNAPDRAIYLLSLAPSDGGYEQFELLNHFTWPKPLRAVLQGWPQDWSLYLYEVRGHLPTDYQLKADGSIAPLLLGRGFDYDGWTTADFDLLLPRETSPASFVELQGVVPGDFHFHFPYVVNYEVAGRSTASFAIEQPGPFTVILPTNGPATGNKVDLHLHAPESYQPSAHPEDGNLDDRRMALRLTGLHSTTKDHFYFQRWVESSWYVPETSPDGHSWRWCNGDGQIQFAFTRPTTIVISLSALSARGSDHLDVLVDDQIAGTIDTPNPGYTPPQDFRFAIQPGQHTLTFHGSRPGESTPTDGRSLSVGVRDVKISLE